MKKKYIIIVLLFLVINSYRCSIQKERIWFEDKSWNYTKLNFKKIIPNPSIENWKLISSSVDSLNLTSTGKQIEFSKSRRILSKEKSISLFSKKEVNYHLFNINYETDTNYYDYSNIKVPIGFQYTEYDDDISWVISYKKNNEIRNVDDFESLKHFLDKIDNIHEALLLWIAYDSKIFEKNTLPNWSVKYKVNKVGFVLQLSSTEVIEEIIYRSYKEVLVDRKGGIKLLFDYSNSYDEAAIFSDREIKTSYKFRNHKWKIIKNESKIDSIIYYERPWKLIVYKGEYVDTVFTFDEIKFFLGEIDNIHEAILLTSSYSLGIDNNLLENEEIKYRTTSNGFEFYFSKLISYCDSIQSGYFIANVSKSGSLKLIMFTKEYAHPLLNISCENHSLYLRKKHENNVKEWEEWK